jgi:hypothetical protein
MTATSVRGNFRVACAPSDLLCSGITLVVIFFLVVGFCIRLGVVLVSAVPLARRFGLAAPVLRDRRLIIGVSRSSEVSEVAFSDLKAVGWLLFPPTMTPDSEEVDAVPQPTHTMTPAAWMQNSR